MLLAQCCATIHLVEVEGFKSSYSDTRTITKGQPASMLADHVDPTTRPTQFYNFYVMDGVILNSLQQLQNIGLKG